MHLNSEFVGVSIGSRGTHMHPPPSFADGTDSEYNP